MSFVNFGVFVPHGSVQVAEIHRGEERLVEAAPGFGAFGGLARGGFGGEELQRERDFAIGRGWFQGYPKKLGSIYVTRAFNHGRAAPRVAPGGAFGASLAAYDHRLATARVTLREPSDTNGFVNGHPMVHHRYMPAMGGQGMSMLQVVTMRGVDADLGQPWVGDAQLELFDSPWDEPASLLPVREVLGGYYREVGVTFAGGELLADMSQPI